MRLTLAFAALCAVIVGVFLVADLDALPRWAVQEQRNVQNQIASAVRALQSGDTGALTTLFSAAAAYGFFHAVGPGHGKVLIGGVGLGTSVSARRLLSISLISSLLQACWAIALVYGGFLLLDLSAQRMTGWPKITWPQPAIWQSH